MTSVMIQSVDSLLPMAKEQTNNQSVIEKKEATEAQQGKSLPSDKVKEVEESEAVSSSIKVDESVEKEILEEAISIVSEFMNQPPRNVNFAQAESSGKTIVQIFDADSQELIKQFPSEKIIDMADKISNLHNEILQKSGMIIDDVV